MKSAPIAYPAATMPRDAVADEARRRAPVPPTTAGQRPDGVDDSDRHRAGLDRKELGWQ